jgi:uncharacterized DUF497 family protein
MDYNFEWDPSKAAANQRKRRVSLEEAATVMLDPRSASLYDEAHSEEEDRWITLGVSSVGRLPVVCHTFRKVDKATSTIRIISCREATKRESEQYRSG